jgi:hypothetical protein
MLHVQKLAKTIFSQKKNKILSLETQHYIKAPTEIILIMIKLLIKTDNNYNVKNNNSIQPQCGVGILDEVSPKCSFNLLAIGVECRLLFIIYFFKLSFSLAILVAAPPPQQQFCATQPRVSVV